MVQLNIDPKQFFLDEVPNWRVDFRIPSVKEKTPKIFEKGQCYQRPKTLTRFEQGILSLANAALPVSQGGLGLAPDNHSKQS